MAETWRAMWDIVKKQFPDAILTSSFRQGDPGYHGKGQAIDIARPYPAESKRMLEFANWIGANYPNSTQLIHTPGPNILNGKPFTYDAPTQRDHYNHVHWAMSTAPTPPKGGTVALPSSDRYGNTVIWVALHTAEGSRRTGDLWAFFNNGQHASSHAGVDGYGLADGWVHPSRAAWTLLNGNSRSMNLEICGFARWTRAQWLSESMVDGCWNPRNMVRLAARWAKQECERFNIPKTHIGINGVRARLRGVIMHDDYSKGANDGTHWDVGTGFPWDVFFRDMGASQEVDDMFEKTDRDKLDSVYRLVNAELKAINGRVEALTTGKDKVPNGPNAGEDVKFWARVWSEALQGDPTKDGKPFHAPAAAWLVDRARDSGRLTELKTTAAKILEILEEAKASADQPEA